MIDIEAVEERNLKNIRQIGTPSEEDRIYIENAAYARIHEEDYAQRRAFIFMGHTECKQGRYTTFVEAAIPVHDLEFAQNIPRWSTHAWSDVFREIKRSYENSIIVGWALDLKGFAPRMTPELEAVHREQFGGAHQVLFLMDSIEGDEYFFLNKGSRLQQKEGFYIYYARELHRVRPAEVTVERERRQSVQSIPQEPERNKGQYREAIQESENRDANAPGKATSYALVAAIALLVVLAGVGVYENRIQIPGVDRIVSAMSQKLKGEPEPAEVLVGTEIEQNATEQVTDTETMTMTENLNLIPIEQVPAGEVPKAEKTQTDENTDTEKADTETQAEETVAQKIPEYYVVEAGDTLSSISREIYGSTKQIAEIVKLNELESSDDIREGQKLLLP